MTPEETKPVVEDFLRRKYPRMAKAKIGEALNLIVEEGEKTAGHNPDKSVEIADRASARLEYRKKFLKDDKISLSDAIREVGEEITEEYQMVHNL
jgi:hypothetical protein